MMQNYCYIEFALLNKLLSDENNCTYQCQIVFGYWWKVGGTCLDRHLSWGHLSALEVVLGALVKGTLVC